MEEDKQLQTFETDEDHHGQRLDVYLSEIYEGRSRSFFQKLIKAGHVKINGIPASKTGVSVCYGDIVEVLIPQAESVEIKAENIPLDILYEDDDVLIVNKPKNMVVHPAAGHYSGTLVNAVMYHCADSLSGINGQTRPGIVHRIDKDTTGALIVCKNDASHICLAQQIKEHTVTRKYIGIVCGQVSADSGIINKPIGRHPADRKKMAVNEKNGRNAITHYKVLERFDRYTFMEFKLETGRTHQIRVHMGSIGHPLLGDELYGNPKDKLAYMSDGQALHAAVIGFIHPSAKEYMEFEAPIPEYLNNILIKLRKIDANMP